MLLSEDQAVIDALKKILESEGYEYLEYDEAYSRNQDLLSVKVTEAKPDRDIFDAHRISKELGQVTGRYFLSPAIIGSRRYNPNTDWESFNIREYKYKKIAVNPDTGQHYQIDLPAPEIVSQAILALIYESEYSSDGIRVVDATERLAELFQLSDEQKHAKNRSNLNVFRYDVVAPQFKRLLREGELKQPKGPRTPYFLHVRIPEHVSDRLAGRVHKTFFDDHGLPILHESPRRECPSVERTALNPDTGAGYQIKLPATNVVKKALLDFDYPPSGIHITDIAEALADQFKLTKKQRKAKGKYGLLWKRHVNIAANSLVNSEKLLRIRVGWIINTEQPNIEPSESDDSPFADGDTPSPEVVMAQNYRKHQDRLKKELLQKIMDNPPEFFEELVVNLLVKMGYGHPRADAEVTGGSGDGGIDGIIYQDPLRLDAVYVQAKRFKDTKVSSSDIVNFTGALAAKGASKGVFITTSRFTKNAKTSANENPNFKIVLINGKKLVQLMIDHDVGVSLGDSYQLKEVDLDYFIIDDDDA